MYIYILKTELRISVFQHFHWLAGHRLYTIYIYIYIYIALINRAGGLYGRILTEVCTSNRGQDSPIQTDLARLIRSILYGQRRKQRNKKINNFICFPARAQITFKVPSSYSVPFFFTNGDEKFGQKKVELIGRYVFNCSRLFQ